MVIRNKNLACDDSEGVRDRPREGLSLALVLENKLPQMALGVHTNPHAVGGSRSRQRSSLCVARRCALGIRGGSAPFADAHAATPRQEQTRCTRLSRWACPSFRSHSLTTSTTSRCGGELYGYAAAASAAGGCFTPVRKAALRDRRTAQIEAAVRLALAVPASLLEELRQEVVDEDGAEAALSNY